MSSIDIRVEMAYQEAMDGWEWIEAIHEAIVSTMDPDDFFELQRWWMETVEGVWREWIESQKARSKT